MIIGIAIDGSQHASRAFDTYVNTCHRPGNQVLLLHVLHVPIPADIPHAAISGHCDAAIKETYELQKIYEKKLADKKINGKWINVRDDKKIGEAIVHVAEANNVELLVIGCRGLGAIRRTFLGSVSDYVLHHCKVPLVICRPEEHHEHPVNMHFHEGPPMP